MVEAESTATGRVGKRDVGGRVWRVEVEEIEREEGMGR